MIRKKITYKDNFVDCYKNQDYKIQEKIEYVLDLLKFEGGQSDIQISTYHKLIEIGLGKHLNISIG